MRIFMQVNGFDVCQVVVDRYTTPTTPPIDRYGNNLSENNSKATNVILNS
jgi:hypothetical protein